MEVITMPVLPIGVATDKNAIYPLEVVKQAVADANRKKFMCQMMMPTNLVFGHAAMVDASHVVEHFSIIDGELYAKLTILDTPYGKLLQEMRSKIPVKFSVAALTDVKQLANGVLEVTTMKIIGVHVSR